MPSIRHHPDYDDMAQDSRWADQQARKLRRRAHLHPMDPDALDEEDLDRLQELEEWEP